MINDFSQSIEKKVSCILKLMNRQNKYMKANSQINSKQNEQGDFDPPVLSMYYMNAPHCTIVPMVLYRSENVQMDPL